MHWSAMEGVLLHHRKEGDSSMTSAGLTEK